MQKPADTHHDIHDLLKNRWSPRAFSNQPLEPGTLHSLFEAARWSPSVGNSQPWSFIVIKKETEVHEKLVSLMTGRNPLWAGNAPVLVVAVAKMNAERPQMNRYAYYDLGQAVAHLTIEAAALDLDVHQMGGLQWDKARELFEIPEGYEPMTLIAIGYSGQVEDLHENLVKDETAPRVRKPIRDFVFGDHWDMRLQTLELEPVLVEP